MQAKDVIVSATVLLAVSGSTPARADLLEYVFGPSEAHGFVSIDSAISAAREAVPGMVVEAELERERGRWVYEVKVITAEHQEVELIFDARTGANIGVARKHKHD